MRNFALAFALVFAASSAIALEARIAISAYRGDRPLISGTTNLPDGTDLMIEISRRQTNFSAQSKTKVVAGKFQAGPFSQYSSPLNPGTYVVEITMPIAEVQSAAVQVSLGSNGEKLTGSLVRRSVFGGKTVEYRTTINVGGGNANAKADAAAKFQAEENKRAWLSQSCQDICVISPESVGRRGHPSSLKICYEACMKEANRGGK